MGRSFSGPNGPVHALQDVSFSIGQGRLVLLLGENGAGKSTLVHVACQVIRPSSGSIALGITQGRELGWCSQAQMIDWWASVQANVQLGPLLAGQTAAQARTSTDRALELVNLSEQKNQLSDALSGGQLQRVQVARALAAEPRLLFLDEPTVGLDAGSSRELLEYLRRRAAAGATIIIASHELELLERYCDEILLLHEGRLVTHSTRQEFLQSWSSDEVAEIDYDGELDAEQLKQLGGIATAVLNHKPLTASVARGSSHLLLQAVAGMVQVRQFSLHSPGLREAYLQFRSAEEQGGER